MAKYEYWRTAEGLLLLEGYARDGMTDHQIAKKVGCSCSTLYEWKKRYSEISEALKKGKEVVDFQVENALLKRALGYDVEDKHIPPDVTAIIFWLKNRRPDRWRQNPQSEIDSAASTLADAINEAWKGRTGK